MSYQFTILHTFHMSTHYIPLVKVQPSEAVFGGCCDNIQALNENQRGTEKEGGDIQARFKV